MSVSNFHIPVGPDLAVFKQKALCWADNFPIAFVLDSNNFSADHYARYELLIGVSTTARPERFLSAYKALSAYSDTFSALCNMSLAQKDCWLFGFLSYDLKNELENLYSNNTDNVDFPDAFFFVPDIVVAVEKNGNSQIIVTSTSEPTNTSPPFDAAEIGLQIGRQSITALNLPLNESAVCRFEQRISRTEYIEKVRKLQQHLALGDIYEINFCQEFYAENMNIRPAPLFHKLCRMAQAPFSSYLKLYGQQYLICASPERFMQKKGQTLRSQPIKGTIRRGFTPNEDALLQQELRQNAKEQAENVMIVDLVRNDLARCAARKSVEVEELFGVYTFPTVHHLISTVKATLRHNLHWTDALKMAFPMGSMTGAPKIRAMQLIEQYESTRRGLFSGSVGYITPSGDFDFNVVIRSLLYNASRKYLSLQTGSAITIYADAEQEYAECLLKAAALRRLLNDPSAEIDRD